MPVAVSDVLKRVKIILQDADSVRWPLPELVDWILDGAKEIALIQPSSSVVTIGKNLVSGTRQTVGGSYQAIIRATRNLDEFGNGKSAITQVDRQVLDAQNDGWHDPSRVGFRALVRHIIIDVMDPQTFYVYPGNDGNGIMECVMSKIPTFNVALGVYDNPNDSTSYLPVTVPLVSVFLSALVDYVLYRAFCKDLQYAGAADRAQSHYGQFTAALNARQAAILTANPNTTGTQPHS